MARGGVTFGIFDIVQYFTAALTCWSICFRTFMMFYLNVGYDNDDV